MSDKIEKYVVDILLYHYSIIMQRREGFCNKSLQDCFVLVLVYHFFKLFLIVVSRQKIRLMSVK